MNKPAIQKTQRRPVTFPKIKIFKVKLVYLHSITLPEKLRIIIAPLQETRQLKQFRPTVNSMDSCDVIEDIQTMRGGNDESYFLHVLSMTGSPHVLLSLSFSNNLELSPPPTTQIMSTLLKSSIAPILGKRWTIQTRDHDLTRMLFSAIKLLQPRLISTRRDESTTQATFEISILPQFLSSKEQKFQMILTLSQPSKMVHEHNMPTVPSLPPVAQQQSPLNLLFDRPPRAQLLSLTAQTSRITPLNKQMITGVIQASRSLPELSSVIFEYKMQTKPTLSLQQSSPKSLQAAAYDQPPCTETLQTRGQVRITSLITALLPPSCHPVLEPFQRSEILPPLPSPLLQISERGEMLQTRRQVKITPLINALLQLSPQQSSLSSVLEPFQPSEKLSSRQSPKPEEMGEIMQTIPQEDDQNQSCGTIKDIGDFVREDEEALDKKDKLDCKTSK